MKRKLNERVKDFFIDMGRKNVILKIPAIIGLAVCMLLYNIYDYCRNGMKRFACVIFILFCFMVGNSFAYPVFQEDNGFISVQNNAVELTAADSNITLAGEQEVEYSNVALLDDEDVLEGYDDAELHDMETANKYLLDEILEENADIINENATLSEENLDDTNQITTVTEEKIEFDANDWKLVLINKQHPIPDEYTFTLGNIKTIKGNMQCDERIIEELLAMLQSAKEDGINLAICSPYRDLNRQEVLFNRKIKAYMDKGMSYMEAYKVSSQAVTVPGASEHQIGLAIDIVSDHYYTLDEGFAETDAGIWLEANSWKYGFILRYPKGKEYITSIEFEPWHFRYVGKEASELIMSENLTLEEFWEKYL